MKTLVFSLGLSALIFSGCVKKPSACYTSVNLPDSGIVNAGTVITFDSRCSKDATDYQWRVLRDSGDVIVEDYFFSGRSLTYAFLKTGDYQIRLMVSRKGKNGNSTGKTVVVK